MIRTWPCWLLAALLGHAPAVGGTISDPVMDLFTPRPPLPAGAEDQPAVLRPPEAAPPPPATILLPGGGRPEPRPPFALNPGERVVFLGDAILEAEADHGYFETRMETQYPGATFTFRNLSLSPHNRLREPDPTAAAADFGWLAPLLEEVRAVHPTLVVLSYGTAAARRGPGALAAFTNVYTRLLDGLAALNPAIAPRLVLLSPLSFEPPPDEPADFATITNRNTDHGLFAETAWLLATNRQAEFVDLFFLSRGEVINRLRAAEAGRSRPRLTEDGVRPTAYGARRLGFALERGLRWTGNNWRFGLMADGSWRSGGFGARIASHHRTDRKVRVVFTEERLTTPPPPGDVEIPDGLEPQCYIQIRNLARGLYELRVDGQGILQATHADWHRYRIISRGPSWDQAEELRRTVVEKNRRWLAAWNQARNRDGAEAPETLDPHIAELEARIAQLKRPVQRTYEVVRIGDAPEGTPELDQVRAP